MDKEFQMFKHLVRESNYDNTYKMAWAKSLVELASEMDLSNEFTTIVFSDIANKYIKYYWNQTIFFNLIQGSNPLRPPVILCLVKKFINTYFERNGSNLPELFERAQPRFDILNLNEEYAKLVRKVISTLKQDVSWRFTMLNGKNQEIYSYTRGNDFLIVKSELLRLFKENERDLYDLINYRWGLVLETFNNSPRINKKVKIMDEREIKRSSLNKFKEYLDLENKDHTCFICNTPIGEKDVSIDHVIPWSYMYSDDIWNLVYVCKLCNSSKSNRIPSEKEIDQLKDRNDRLLQSMIDHHIKNKMYEELNLAISKDYVNKFWIGSKN